MEIKLDSGEIVCLSTEDISKERSEVSKLSYKEVSEYLQYWCGYSGCKTRDDALRRAAIFSHGRIGRHRDGTAFFAQTKRYSRGKHGFNFLEVGAGRGWECFGFVLDNDCDAKQSDLDYFIVDGTTMKIHKVEYNHHR